MVNAMPWKRFAAAENQGLFRSLEILRTSRYHIAYSKLAQYTSVPHKLIWRNRASLVQDLIQRSSPSPFVESHGKLFKMAPNNLPSVFNATSQDIEMLLAAQCHLGSKNMQTHMEPYLWKTRPDGINVINIGKTW